MHCNKCGRENPDDATACRECGHKLQSGRAGARPGEGREGPGLLPPLSGAGPGARKKMRLLAEAWAVAALVWLCAWGVLQAGFDWALYPLAALAAGYAWMRGITWGD